MATVAYRIRSNANKDVSIYVYLSLGRDKMVQCKTGFVINPKDWSDSTKKPKQNTAINKKVFNDLKKLESHIYSEINNSNSKGEIIDHYWLNKAIDECFGRISSEDSKNNLLIWQTEYMIKNANTRKIKGSGKIGLSKNTINGYVTFLQIIKRYEKRIRKQIRLTDINNEFITKFTNWLINECNYSINHSGKQVSFIKTIGNDSFKRGLLINPYVKEIESFKDSKENKYIVTLTFDEIEKIKSKHIENDYLINARKWLLLGCEIGQRGGDLLRLSKENIRYSSNNLLIDIYQEKTAKTVTVPITKNYIENFIKSEFPHKISLQKLNNYIKELCEYCEIIEPTKGKKFDAQTKRKMLGTYPKYKLITSHVFRRSFATNYYKLIPTPILIEITGHSKESMFLEYIGKPKDKDENANLFLKLVREMNSAKESQLKAI